MTNRALLCLSQTFALERLRELTENLEDGRATLCEFRVVVRPIQERERLLNPNVREISIVYEEVLP